MWEWKGGREEGREEGNEGRRKRERERDEKGSTGQVGGGRCGLERERERALLYSLRHKCYTKLKLIVTAHLVDYRLQHH